MNSKFEYVKGFERDDRMLPNCWIVIRIDGKGFHKFTTDHGYQKPNDLRGIGLMNCAALRVMEEFSDIILSYGQSDEYSFVIEKDSKLFSRREAKLTTLISSLFASSFVFNWNSFFPDTKLQYAPFFDARAVLYPSDQNLLDYLSWRQADCHINNLYNTVFWTLVQKGGLSTIEAEKKLKGTLSEQKNEILFKEFSINYNNEPAIFRKGSIQCFEFSIETFYDSKNSTEKKKLRKKICLNHEDLISSLFWKQRPYLLDKSKAKIEFFEEKKN